jgi:hypothetical protein
MEFETSDTSDKQAVSPQKFAFMTLHLILFISTEVRFLMQSKSIVI